VVAVGLVAMVLGTTLRAIGRGFGRGTLGLAAQASTASAEKPTANVRLVAKAVDRNAAARTRRFTAFLHGESFDRSVSGLVD
jgi:phosphohistidine swiveling domain-containing protein